MTTKWLYEFFTDTSNAMSIEERIGETVTNMGMDGVTFPDGECCKTEKELRLLLAKKGILKEVDGTVDMMDVFAKITDILG